MSNVKHSHYKKDISKLSVLDFYRICQLFEVTDHALGHAAKKIFFAGKRGAKNIDKDIQEAIDTLVRWQEMRTEDSKTWPSVGVAVVPHHHV